MRVTKKTNQLTYMFLAFLFALNGHLLAQSPFAKLSKDYQEIDFITKELAPGTYALLSSVDGWDNTGFVVGARGVLVVDAHATPRMAKKIQQAIRSVTDKPILYLVNSNWHGDHTFGNMAFPAETKIISHTESAKSMVKNFDNEKQFFSRLVGNDLADVEMREPNIVFDDQMRIDLGDMLVELHYFGVGNTRGDVVTYVPSARVAWTGNLVLGWGRIPGTNANGPIEYMQTLTRLLAELDVDTIVPSHASAGLAALTTPRAVAAHLLYMQQLLEEVRRYRRAGNSLEETLAALPLSTFRTTSDTPPWQEVLPGAHQRNVSGLYKMLVGDVEQAGGTN